MNNEIVGIATSVDSGNEAEAIRQSLEYFGFKTILFQIGRPNHWLKLMSGTLSPCRLDYMIFCVHGEGGKFVLPELHESVYEENEPRARLAAADIKQFASFPEHTKIINTGCGLGMPEMGQAFIEQGANSYIAPADDIEANALLAFVVRFFYEIKQNGRTLSEAFELASSLDDETKLFKLFVRG